jgi:hypothetical protein
MTLPLEAGILDEDLVDEGAGLVAVDVEVGLELLEAQPHQGLLVGGVEHRLELAKGELKGKVLLPTGEGFGHDKANLGA